MGKDRNEKITRSPPRIFKGQQRPHRTDHRGGGQETRCFLNENSVPISGRADFPRDNELLQRKDNSSPGPSLDVSEFWLRLTALCPEVTYLQCPVGEYYPIPFGRSETNTIDLFAFFGRRLASERISPIP
ncbi:hypothetical protein JTE90_015441 [Oedothorax gibbosus]|uniref:Uncharacterized protein n=1 Tax=Oedothorax gibbosus TaxID=931172 RepID=A0AAV6TGN2_9ARAC|nr:hypothetical protein JTE90_015441 [Oedothorax gibbosus]